MIQDHAMQWKQELLDTYMTALNEYILDILNDTIKMGGLKGSMIAIVKDTLLKEAYAKAKASADECLKTELRPYTNNDYLYNHLNEMRYKPMIEAIKKLGENQV